MAATTRDDELLGARMPWGFALRSRVPSMPRRSIESATGLERTSLRSRLHVREVRESVVSGLRDRLLDPHRCRRLRLDHDLFAPDQTRAGADIDEGRREVGSTSCLARAHPDLARGFNLVVGVRLPR